MTRRLFGALIAIGLAFGIDSVSAESLLVRSSKPISKVEGASHIRNLHFFDDYFEVTLESGRSGDEVTARLKNVEGVTYVGKNSRLFPLSHLDVQSSKILSNDPLNEKCWWHEASNIYRAWKHSRGSKSIIVGVVDTGFATSHPDLAPNIFVNQGELGPNSKVGVDDDGNGVIDDIHGYNFGDRSNHVQDDVFTYGHGTVVSGILGAKGNNKIGISGVAWRVTILPVRMWDKNGDGWLIPALESLEYAARMGAKIVNISWGTKEYEAPLFDQLKSMSDRGILIIAGAGNNGTDSDGPSPYYPASFKIENLIAVGGTDKADELWKVQGGGSNYGKNSVHLAAPAQTVYSTLAKNIYMQPGGYGGLTGTSLSTPIVTGTAALMLSANPKLKAQDLKKIILETVTPLPSLKDKTITGGKINVARAVRRAIKY